MAMVANKVTLCWPNRTDQSTLSLGGWSGTLPLNNLKNRVIAKKARTTDAAEANTKFNVALDKARPMFAVALAGHNFSADAQWRVRMYADYARTVLKWDSGGQEAFALTRAGDTATRFNSSGVLEVINANLPRWDYDPITLAFKGMLIEPVRINSIRNNTMVGGVAGAPGTLPTNWSGTVTQNGITRSVVGVGVENGIEYIDLRFAGTGTGTGYHDVAFDLSVVAAVAQTWTGSAYFRLVGGSFSGVAGGSSLILYGEPSYGDNTSVGITGVTSAALRTQRLSATKTFTDGATNGADLRMSVVAGTNTIDVTIRVGLPQLEQGAQATSVIKTSSAAVTRNGDVGSLLANAISGFDIDKQSWFAEALVAAVDTANFPRLVGFDTGSETPLYVEGSTRKAGAYDGTADTKTTNTVTLGTPFKAASAFDAPSDAAVVLDGGTVATSTAANFNVATTTIHLGSNNGGSNFLNGHLRKLRLYNSRLSNADLQTLTSGGTISATPILDWDAADQSLNFDVAGGRRSVWPDFFEYEQLAWEDDNFWFGNDSLDVAADYTPLATMFADDIKPDVRALLVELFDADNTAGYLEAGRLFVATGWQPELNADYGMQFGHEAPTVVEEALDGTEYFDRRRAKRTVQFQLAELGTTDAFRTVYAGQRDLNLDGEVLFAYNIDDSDPAYLYRTFLARYLRLDPIAQPYYERHNAPYMLREIL